MEGKVPYRCQQLCQVRRTLPMSPLLKHCSTHPVPGTLRAQICLTKPLQLRQKTDSMLRLTGGHTNQLDALVVWHHCGRLCPDIRCLSKSLQGFSSPCEPSCMACGIRRQRDHVSVCCCGGVPSLLPERNATGDNHQAAALINGHLAMLFVNSADVQLQISPP